jgi:hypothetical protein
MPNNNHREANQASNTSEPLLGHSQDEELWCEIVLDQELIESNRVGQDVCGTLVDQETVPGELFVVIRGNEKIFAEVSNCERQHVDLEPDWDQGGELLKGDVPSEWPVHAEHLDDIVLGFNVEVGQDHAAEHKYAREGAQQPASEVVLHSSDLVSPGREERGKVREHEESAH